MSAAARAADIRLARVLIAESARRRGNPVNRGFQFLLLEWAANARRRAAAGDLFGPRANNPPPGDSPPPNQALTCDRSLTDSHDGSERTNQ